MFGSVQNAHKEGVSSVGTLQKIYKDEVSSVGSLPKIQKDALPACGEICNSITQAIRRVAHESLLSYTVDPEVLQRIVGAYLQEHPTHTDPSKVVACNVEDMRVDVNFYDLNYRWGNVGTLSGFEQGRLEGQADLSQFVLLDGRSDVPGEKWGPGKFIRAPGTLPTFINEGTVTLGNGMKQSGRWCYIPQARGVCLLEGEMVFPSGNVHRGTFRYYPEMGLVGLLKGSMENTKDGYVEEGTFACFPGCEKGRLRVVSGTKRYGNGREQTGSYKYVPELNKHALFVGKETFKGVTKDGIWKPVLEMNAMQLKHGVLKKPTGELQDGLFDYIPELQDMRLVDGIIKKGPNDKGIRGTWAYDPKVYGMVFQPKKNEPVTLPKKPEPKSIPNAYPLIDKGRVRGPGTISNASLFGLIPSGKLGATESSPGLQNRVRYQGELTRGVATGVSSEHNNNNDEDNFLDTKPKKLITGGAS
jgi:hypothetical protein